jgi:hypothetical protein
MYYTGIDPFTKQEVYVARHLSDRKLQRALMQFFKPENYFAVRQGLEQAGRTDLIGGGCDALIPPQPPPEALRARRERGQRGGARRPLPHGAEPGARQGLSAEAEDGAAEGQAVRCEQEQRIRANGA